ELKPSDASLFNARGRAYTVAKDWDRALADFDRVTTLDAKNADAYVGRANVLEQKGESERALAEYDKALAIDAKNVGAVAGRGRPRPTGRSPNSIARFPSIRGTPIR